MTTDLAVQKDLVETIEVNGHKLRRVKSKGLICVRDILDAVGIKETQDWIERLGKVSNLTVNDKVSNRVVLEYHDIGKAGKAAFTNEAGLLEILARSRKPAATAKLHEIINELKARARAVIPTGSPWAAIQAMAGGLMELKDDVDFIKVNQGAMMTDIAALKAATDIKALANPVPSITRRQETVALIDRHMNEHPGDFPSFRHAWNHLWDLCRLRMHRDIAGEARSMGWTSVIAYAEHVNEIERVWQIAKEAFGK